LKCKASKLQRKPLQGSNTDPYEPWSFVHLHLVFLKVHFWGMQSALRPWPLYSLVQSPWYHLIRKLGGHQSPYWHGSQEKYFSLNWISNVSSLAIQLHT